MVKNLTPHAIVVDNGTSSTTYEPSGLVARVDTNSTTVSSVDGFTTITTSVKGHNLPDPIEGTYLLVSAMVLSLCSDRRDLIAPNTGEAVRNEKGHIVSVPGFITNPQ